VPHAMSPVPDAGDAEILAALASPETLGTGHRADEEAIKAWTMLLQSGLDERERAEVFAAARGVLRVPELAAALRHFRARRAREQAVAARQAEYARMRVALPGQANGHADTFENEMESFQDSSFLPTGRVDSVSSQIDGMSRPSATAWGQTRWPPPQLAAMPEAQAGAETPRQGGERSATSPELLLPSTSPMGQWGRPEDIKALKKLQEKNQALTSQNHALLSEVQLLRARAQELAALEAQQLVKLPGPELWGITVGQLEKFRDRHRSELRAYVAKHQTLDVDGKTCHVCMSEPCEFDHGSCSFMPPSLAPPGAALAPLRPDMNLVVGKFVKPAQKSQGRSVALMLNESGLNIKSFVSHCWSENFDEFVDTLVLALPKDEPVFVAAFSIYQHAESDILREASIVELDVGPSGRALRHAQRVVLVVDKEGAVLRRLWCNWELYRASRLHKPLLLCPSRLANVDDLQELIPDWSLAASSATSEEVLRRLRKAIADGIGNQDFDEALRHAFGERLRPLRTLLAYEPGGRAEFCTQFEHWAAEKQQAFENFEESKKNGRGKVGRLERKALEAAEAKLGELVERQRNANMAAYQEAERQAQTEQTRQMRDATLRLSKLVREAQAMGQQAEIELREDEPALYTFIDFRSQLRRVQADAERLFEECFVQDENAGPELGDFSCASSTAAEDVELRSSASFRADDTDVAASSPDAADRATDSIDAAGTGDSGGGNVESAVGGGGKQSGRFGDAGTEPDGKELGTAGAAGTKPDGDAGGVDAAPASGSPEAPDEASKSPHSPSEELEDLSRRFSEAPSLLEDSSRRFAEVNTALRRLRSVRVAFLARQDEGFEALGMEALLAAARSRQKKFAREVRAIAKGLKGAVLIQEPRGRGRFDTKAFALGNGDASWLLGLLRASVVFKDFNGLYDGLSKMIDKDVEQNRTDFLIVDIKDNYQEAEQNGNDAIVVFVTVDGIVGKISMYVQSMREALMDRRTTAKMQRRAGQALLMVTAQNEASLVTAVVRQQPDFCDAPVFDRNGRSPLHYACQLGNPELVSCLLQAQADPWAVDHRGALPCEFAFKNAHFDAAVAMLAHMSEHRSESGELCIGRSVLPWLCDYVGHDPGAVTAELVPPGAVQKVAAKAGAKKAPKAQEAPPAPTSALSVGRALVEFLQHSEAANGSVEALLLASARQGRTGRIRCLLAFGADVEPGPSQSSGLELCIEAGHEDAALVFVSQAAALKLGEDELQLKCAVCTRMSVDEHLKYASQSTDARIARTALSVRADPLAVQAMNAGQRTPLMCFAAAGNFEMCRRLCGYPKLLARRDDCGLRASYYARARGQTEVAKFLEELEEQLPIEKASDVHSRGSDMLSDALAAGCCAAVWHVSQHAGARATMIGSGGNNLDYNPYISQRAGQARETPLHKSLMRECLEHDPIGQVCKSLIFLKADPTMLDAGGNTVLHTAILSGSLDLYDEVFNSVKAWYDDAEAAETFASVENKDGKIAGQIAERLRQRKQSQQAALESEANLKAQGDPLLLRAAFLAFRNEVLDARLCSWRNDQAPSIADAITGAGGDDDDGSEGDGLANISLMLDMALHEAGTEGDKPSRTKKNAKNVGRRRSGQAAGPVGTKVAKQSPSRGSADPSLSAAAATALAASAAKSPKPGSGVSSLTAGDSLMSTSTDKAEKPHKTPDTAVRRKKDAGRRASAPTPGTGAVAGEAADGAQSKRRNSLARPGLAGDLAENGGGVDADNASAFSEDTP